MGLKGFSLEIDGVYVHHVGMKLQKLGSPLP
jgi:hypothetical protein